MPRMLRWGLLSTARINQAVISPIRDSPRHELLAVASRDLQRASEYASENEIERFYGSYEELLEDPEIDVVYIPLPNHLHAEWAIRAAWAGKHVLVEKPIALTIEEVEQIEDAALHSGVVIAEAFMYRHHAQFKAIKEIVDSGQLGEIRLMRGVFSYTLKRPGDIRWVPEYGGGAIWDIGCYPVSYARGLLGMNPDEVMAWQNKAPSGVDATVAGLLRYPNNATLQMSCSFELTSQSAFEIRGTEGTLIIPDAFKPGRNLVGLLHMNGLEEESIDFPEEDLYLGEVDDIADAVMEGKPTTLSLEESRQNIATLVALLQSAEEGRPVQVAV